MKTKPAIKLPLNIGEQFYFYVTGFPLRFSSVSTGPICTTMQPYSRNKKTHQTTLENKEIPQYKLFKKLKLQRKNSCSKLFGNPPGSREKPTVKPSHSPFSTVRAAASRCYNVTTEMRADTCNAACQNDIL